jgi:phosphoribosyl 1,2-cyclic phosphodiesterase
VISIAVLGSGSSGNAIWVEAGDTSILFDAGFSRAELLRRMEAIGLAPEALDAVVVSHEHSDHVAGLRVFLKRRELPLFATAPTLEALDRLGVGMGEAQPIDGAFTIGDAQIRPVPVTHDAADPVGFVITSGGVKLGIVTDLGCVTEPVRHRLTGCHALLLEFNHDLDMLNNGSYHPSLKARIRGRHGHLCNADAADLAADLLHDDFQLLLLGHLSDNNNTPKLALKEARRTVPRGVQVVITDQDRPWGPITIG